MEQKPFDGWESVSPQSTSLLYNPLQSKSFVSAGHQTNMSPPNTDILTKKVKVAAVHAAPVFMNKDATTKKVIGLIEQAGKEKIELLVFPETFIPGYPVS